VTGRRGLYLAARGMNAEREQIEVEAVQCIVARPSGVALLLWGACEDQAREHVSVHFDSREALFPCPLPEASEYVREWIFLLEGATASVEKLSATLASVQSLLSSTPSLLLHLERVDVEQLFALLASGAKLANGPTGGRASRGRLVALAEAAVSCSMRRRYGWSPSHVQLLLEDLRGYSDYSEASERLGLSTETIRSYWRDLVARARSASCDRTLDRAKLRAELYRGVVEVRARFEDFGLAPRAVHQHGPERETASRGAEKLSS